MTDNGAVLAGFTEEWLAYSGSHDLFLLVKPGTDLTDRFRAWCCDEQEFIMVNGWLYTYEKPEN